MTALSALLPFVFLLQLILQVRLPGPDLVLGMGLVLGLMLLGLAWWLRLPWLTGVAMSATLLLESAWHLEFFAIRSPGSSLFWYVTFYLFYFAHPFLGGRRFQEVVPPWRVAALAGGSVQRIGLSATIRPLEEAARFLPGLRTTGGRQWMGFRPSLPDSLPAIGPLPGRPDVICAFGHGHLGLTQAAGTAEIVADLLTGRTPRIDLPPFSPARFARRP